MNEAYDIVLCSTCLKIGFNPLFIGSMNEATLKTR
jgi:hypothetical protein